LPVLALSEGAGAVRTDALPAKRLEQDAGNGMGFNKPACNSSRTFFPGNQANPYPRRTAHGPLARGLHRCDGHRCLTSFEQLPTPTSEHWKKDPAVARALSAK
jgi:hypothetical protein